MTDEWMRVRDRLFIESILEGKMSRYKLAMFEEVCHFYDISLLEEVCHFCDMSLKERIKPLTSKERAIRKFGWKFDKDSLLYASTGMMGTWKDYRTRTRQFLDDVRECEHLYGEYRYYDDLLWGWSGDQ